MADSEAEIKAKADAQAKADAEAKAKADSEAKAKADAEAEEKAKADKVRADAEIEARISKAVADAMAKRDSEDAEKKAKADAEAKAKADAMADPAQYADAQARADTVFAMLGKSAPRPLVGETLPAYRRRLIGGLKEHSPSYKGVEVAALADEQVLAIAERTVYADAAAFANTPMSAADGGLRETKRTSAAGHQISTFTGDPFAWMGQFMLRPRTGTTRSIDDIRRLNA
jgi:septal ring factor EnvC (AmiA/AmiB activator)